MDAVAMIMNAVSPFDAMAATYDAAFTNSVIGKMQRERVWTFLAKILARRKSFLKILELNCGTGEDAILFAEMGHKVTATDASANMISKAKEKLGHHFSKVDVEFSVCSFDQVTTKFLHEKFDLVFSNFGGLNCIDASDLKKLSDNLMLITEPAADLFFVIMGSCCVQEIFAYFKKGQLKTATRRWHTASFKVGEVSMPVHYYSPGKTKNIFADNFLFQEQHPIGLFIPPSYLEDKYTNKVNKLQRLNRLEEKWDHPMLANFADHYSIHLKKKSL